MDEAVAKDPSQRQAGLHGLLSSECIASEELGAAVDDFLVEYNFEVLEIVWIEVGNAASTYYVGGS